MNSSPTPDFDAEHQNPFELPDPPLEALYFFESFQIYFSYLTNTQFRDSLLETQLAPYLARELSEINQIQDSRRSQGGAP